MNCFPQNYFIDIVIVNYIHTVTRMLIDYVTSVGVII
jgi:hypothetical protein